MTSVFNQSDHWNILKTIYLLKYIKRNSCHSFSINLLWNQNYTVIKMNFFYRFIDKVKRINGSHLDKLLFCFLLFLMQKIFVYHKSTLINWKEQLLDIIEYENYYFIAITVSFAILPIVAMTILITILCQQLHHRSYTEDRRLYAQWLFFKLVTDVQKIQEISQQKSQLDSQIWKEITEKISNELICFKENASNLLDSTVLDYASNPKTFFEIDPNEKLKLFSK